MAPMAGSMATLDDYAYNLRSGLRQAALANLVDLEAMIQDQGYAWLDGYEEEVMSRPMGASITQLMKTPSRTATVRRTRTTTNAAKDRVEKVKQSNKERAGSPSPAKPAHQVRTVLSPLQPSRVNSPLQPRMINQLVSPVPASPLPIKKPAKGGKKKAAAAKAAPARKGRGKKQLEKDEEARAPTVEQVREDDPVSGPSWRTVMTDEASSATVRPTPPIDAQPDQPAEVEPEKPKRSAKSKRKAAPEPTTAVAPIVEREQSPVVAEEPREAEEELEVVKSPVKPAKKSKSTSTRSKGKAVKVATVPAVVPDPEPEPESRPTQVAELAADEVEASAPLRPEMTEIQEELEIPVLEQVSADDSDEVVVMDTVPDEERMEPEIISSVTAQADSLIPAPLPVQEKRHSAEEALALLSGPASISHPLPSHQASQVLQPAAASMPPAITSAPSAFVPKVRSSWLSKALGGGVDVRKSVAPSMAGPSGLQHAHLAQRQHTIDLAAIRKSLAPAGVLKRKSDHGNAEEDKVELHEYDRPEKHVKLDVASGPARPVLNRVESKEKDIFSAPARQSFLPTKSAFKDAMSVGVPTLPVSATAHPSDISRINAQLEEMTKKAAAKEAARKQAALAASENQPWNPESHARQASGGFFRNIGSMGAALGRSIGVTGSPKSAREEAERLARELEEDREAEQEAQRELARLMGEVEDRAPTATGLAEMERDSTIPPEAPADSEARVSNAPTEDAQEEDEILAELSRVEEPEEEEELEVTPSRPAAVLSSTTPAVSPPRRAKPPAEDRSAPAQHSRSPQQTQRTGLRLPSPRGLPDNAEDEDLPELPQPTPKKRGARQTDDAGDGAETNGGDGVIALMLEKAMNQQAKARAQPLPKSSSGQSLNKNVLGNSTASNNTMLNRASVMAGKSLGFKPSINPIKSVQAAAQAAKSEQALREARLAQRAEIERKKEALAQQKAQEEARKKEEDKRQREAALEKQRRLRIESEKARAERELKLKQMHAEREARERAEKEEAARSKAKEEEERRRKHAEKMAKMSQQNLKKPPAVSSSAPPAQPMIKVGPTILKTAGQGDMFGGSKVGPSDVQRAPLGQPALASAIRPSHQAGPSNAHGHATLPSSAILAQSRLDLQATLQQQALDVESEDIVLPDIASEYSDSGDEKSPDFKRPTWAESPLLREALAQQASRDPDELFGPIKPVAMEELFKIKTSKYRARTSSANWVIKGDGLTKAEEAEYAKRMGFRPMAHGQDAQAGGSVFQ